MPTDATPPARRLATRLVHSERRASTVFESLAVPTYRGSTVVFDSLAEVADDWRGSDRYRYGLYGTPTTRELGLRIAAIEGAAHTFILPGGQAAIALVYLAYCPAGSHALLPRSAYGPNRELAEGLLAGLDIEVELYDPLIGGGIAALMRDNSRLVWCESPGSITMEVQDVPAICAAARSRGVPVALDNTYAAGVLFDAFGAGVDISMQALTKYVGGHSDLLLGSISVSDPAHLEKIGRMHRLLGMAVSPDDCALALRGLLTLDVRLKQIEQSTLVVANWLQRRDEVSEVLHPAMPDCPGHDIWRRDFSGSAGLFSIVLGGWSPDQVASFVEGLTLFKLGYSWGGVTSLVMSYPQLSRPDAERGPRLVRLNIGLEDPRDLIDDLELALAKASLTA